MSKPMSETKTIEERYEKIIGAYYGRREIALARAKDLLRDLMAERGKKVNLDEIFPREIMKKAEWFGCYHEESGEYTEPGDTIEAAICGYCDWLDTDLYVLFDQVVDVEVIAYGENHKELARVRVRLGLTVEIVEDK